ncbi:MAG: DUF6092 family protein [Chloroflexota bacterium]
MRSNIVLNEEEAVELYTLLIMSARTQLDDPCQYASMRLLDAAIKLGQMVEGQAGGKLQDMLGETAIQIDDAIEQMNNPADYTLVLDGICGRVAQFLVETSQLGGVKDGDA